MKRKIYLKCRWSIKLISICPIPCIISFTFHVYMFLLFLIKTLFKNLVFGITFIYIYRNIENCEKYVASCRTSRTWFLHANKGNIRSGVTICDVSVSKRRSDEKRRKEKGEGEDKRERGIQRERESAERREGKKGYRTVEWGRIVRT